MIQKIKFLELCQYQPSALRPEVSSPPGPGPGFDHGMQRHTHSQLMNITTLDTELAQWAVSAKNLGNKRLVCVPHRNVCNQPTRAKNQKIYFQKKFRQALSRIHSLTRSLQSIWLKSCWGEIKTLAHTRALRLIDYTGLEDGTVKGLKSNFLQYFSGQDSHGYRLTVTQCNAVRNDTLIQCYTARVSSSVIISA